MDKPESIPSIFISYSWTPKSNQLKVIEIAERLVENGIKVILDIWDLKEGQDKYQFMEQMVTAPEINRVLLMCNKDYKQKADTKKGGVGTESLIISDEVYNQAKQEKFIPIILEKTADNKPIMPTFVKSRISIDFSDEEYFETEFEKLIRNIYNKPLYRKPALGSAPLYIKDDDFIPTSTSSKLRELKNAYIKGKSYADNLLQEYFIQFLASLQNFEINVANLKEEINDKILEKIQQMNPLVDEFNNLLHVLLKYSEFDENAFHNFFEKALEFLLKIESENSNYPKGSIGSVKRDHFYFLFYELLLLFTTHLLEKEKYQKLANFIHKSFTVYYPSQRDYISLSYINICTPANSLNDLRIKRLNLNKTNITGELIKQRVRENLDFNSILQADLVLYYISLFIAKNSYSRLWFPFTSIYYLDFIPIFKKCKSKSFLQSILPLFKTKTIQELEEKLEYIEENNIDRLERHIYNIPLINYLLGNPNIGQIE